MISFILFFPFDKINSWWNSGYWHDLQIHSIHFSCNWTCSFHEIAKKKTLEFPRMPRETIPWNGNLRTLSSLTAVRMDRAKINPFSHDPTSSSAFILPSRDRLEERRGRSSFAGPSISPCMVATRSATIVGRPPNRIMDHRCKRIEGSIIRRFHSGGTRNRSQNVGPNRVQITDPRFYYRWILSVDG